MTGLGGYDDININLRFWLQRIIRALPRPRVMYDIGANEGQLSLPLLAELDRLVAFEPNEPAADRFEVRAKEWQRAAETYRLFRLALSDTSGTAELRRYSDDTFSSLYRRPDTDLSDYGLLESETATVVTEQLDQVVHQENLPVPSLLKIDVEGAELPVLRGARNTLGSVRPVVVIEYSCVNTRNAGYDRTEIRHELERYNYRIGGLYRAEERELRFGADLNSCRIWNLVCLPEELVYLTDIFGVNTEKGL